MNHQQRGRIPINSTTMTTPIATTIPAVKINENATCIYANGQTFVVVFNERWGMETTTYGAADMFELFGKEATMFVMATLGCAVPA